MIQFTRRGSEIRVFVDDLPPVSGTLPTPRSTSQPSITPVKYTISSLTSPFTGTIQSLTINNIEFLSAIKLRRLKPSSPTQSPSIRTFKSINNPIQFLVRSSGASSMMSKSSPPGYVRLPQLKAYSTVRIRFKFKTQAANGVLFYNGASSSSDYVCVQIEDFKVVFSMGFFDEERGVEIISHRLKLDSWVDVDVWWDGGRDVVMGVDQYVYEERIRGMVSGDEMSETQSGSTMVLKLNGVLYVGGGVGEIFHARVSSYNNNNRNNAAFVGCIANVDLGGEGVSFEGAGGGILHGCGGHGPGGGLGESKPRNRMAVAYPSIASKTSIFFMLPWPRRAVQPVINPVHNGQLRERRPVRGRLGQHRVLRLRDDQLLRTHVFARLVRLASSPIVKPYHGNCNARFVFVLSHPESIAYEFSSSSSSSTQQLYRNAQSRPGHSRPGVIQFTYQQNREPTTLHDNIAFGFITGSHDAVILRIESVKTTDYLEIEMVRFFFFGSHCIHCIAMGIS